MKTLHVGTHKKQWIKTMRSLTWLAITGLIVNSILSYLLLTMHFGQFVTFFSLQFFQILGSLTPIGLGLGVPFALIALIFGWMQLTLLVKGQVSPHLSNAGFFETIRILLTR